MTSSTSPRATASTWPASSRSSTAGIATAPKARSATSSAPSTPDASSTRHGSGPGLPGLLSFGAVAVTAPVNWPDGLPTRPYRHHHLRHPAPGQLRRRDPPGDRRQPCPGRRKLLLPRRLPRPDQGTGSGAGATLDPGDRGGVAGLRTGTGEGAVLPPERH